MRLEISEAISLILALPAHRSHDEGHKKMGERAFDLLFEYKELPQDEIEKAFNRAMIGSVLSTVRAFSVERDRINNKWSSIDATKKHRERYITIIRNLSPLEKGNYWSKTLTLIIAAGVTIKFPLIDVNWKFGVIALILIIIALEVLSKFLEIRVSGFLEKRIPVEKDTAWENENMQHYKAIVSKFIDEALSHYKKYYPNETTLYGYALTTPEEITKFKEYLLNLHFYF